MHYIKLITAFNATFITIIAFAIKQKQAIYPITNEYQLNYIISSISLLLIPILTTFLQIALLKKKEGKK